MTTLTQTDLDNAHTDAVALASFVNDAAGTVATRTGGTIQNLKSLIATILAFTTGAVVLKTTAGDVTVGNTDRIVLIKKVTPAPTAVNVGLAANRSSNLPLLIGNLGLTADYVTNPTTVQLTSPNTFSNGDSSFVMDGGEQQIELIPLPDNSGYFIKKAF